MSTRVDFPVLLVREGYIFNGPLKYLAVRFNSRDGNER